MSNKLVGVNTSVIGSECSVKSSTELKELYNVLGDSFIQDRNNINNGYPVLNWQ